MFGFSLLFSLLLTFYDPPESPQVIQLTFNLLNKKKEKIGEIKAVKTVEQNETIYEAETWMTVKFVMKQDIYYHVRSVYRNGILQSGSGKSFINKNQHSTCRISLRGNVYEVQKDSASYTLKSPLSYSGAMLYFQEPPAKTHMFSELNGYLSSIFKASENQYIMIDGKSKKQNRYFYRPGGLDNAYINHTFLDLIVQRVK